MAYQLNCKECGSEISAQQYDAYLGLCPYCFANEEDLHDENFHPDDEDPDEADQRGLSNMPHQ